jgi:hypothetical protein
MDIWGVLVYVLESIAASLVVILLGWMAIERGRIHDQLRGGRTGAAVGVVGWRPDRLKRRRLLRLARDPRRLHVVVSAIAGWM